MPLPPLERLDRERFESPHLLRQITAASRQLAELKGIVASIPSQALLINTLGLQEAKDSSAIENIITTHDDLFEGASVPDDNSNSATKEVLRYGWALRVGFDAVREKGLLTNAIILDVQAELERNQAGFRRLPGTKLRDQDGRIVYSPPEPDQIIALMTDLERFINDDALFPVDPLIRMALIHHQFESIHPFYDGNGRTGRIINVLYLVQQRLLDLPVLYMSRHIVRTKSEYYRLLQTTRDEDRWEDWVSYMLTAVEETAREGITAVTAIRTAFFDYKHRIREQHHFYSQDLINNLFSHPYTKVQFIERDLGVSRLTAARYLDALVDDGFLRKHRKGRTNFYVNVALYGILTGDAMVSGQ